MKRRWPCTALVLCVALALALPSCRPRNSARRQACVNNLRQIGLALALYANENRDRYPPIDDRPWNLMFEGDVMFPEFLTDVSIVGCPSDPSFDPNVSFRLREAHATGWHPGLRPGNPHADCLDSTSYQYTGWHIDPETSSAEVWAISVGKIASVLEWSDNRIDQSGRPVNAWRDNYLNLASFGFVGSGYIASDNLFRLSNRIGIHHLYPEQLHAQSPVMWDEISTNVTEFSHVPAGQNILYLDGHVEFTLYRNSNDRFPSSPLAAAILGSIEIASSDDPRVPWGECP